MSKGIPVAVLVARLENELETLRIHMGTIDDAAAYPALDKAVDLAKQIREAL